VLRAAPPLLPLRAACRRRPFAGAGALAPPRIEATREGGVSMAESTAEDLKTLRAELANLRADFGRIAETLKDTVKHGREEAVGKAHEAADKLQDEIGKRTQRL